MTDRDEIERIVRRPIADVRPGRWGFTNRTDLVQLADGELVVARST